MTQLDPAQTEIATRLAGACPATPGRRARSRLCLVSLVVTSSVLAGCVDDREGEGSLDSVRPVATTVALPDGVEPGETTPADFEGPESLPELEGLTVAEAERQARDRGWTTVESYTRGEYASLSFDAIFIPTQLTLIYDPDTGLVTETTVG